MTIATVAGLVETLKQSRLLAPAQLDELARSLHTSFTEPRALARDLLQRGWLTPYQINQLFQERASSLVLGQYLLLERLGEGGMGQVFKARHQRLERLVALKVIRKERLTHPDAIHRFQREARAAARLSHPNIVTVYDADDVGGTHFFAMEYVEGTDLAKVVKERGALPVVQACEYIRQAALGLQHACERGLVHRDIKPANLFLTTGGVVKILDMGLARFQGVAEETGDDTDPLTQAGVVMGTPDYIAPEQAMDVHKADIRADLYSLGCTLYHLLSGRVPFPGGTFMEKVDRHRRQEAEPLERLRPEVPPAVAAVVRNLMAKRPEDRYQTPAELAQALVPWAGPPAAIPVSAPGSTLAWKPEANLNTQGSTATVPGGAPGSSYPIATLYQPSPGRSRKRWRIVAAGGAALFALVVSVLLFFGKGKEAGKEKTGSERLLDDVFPSRASGQLKEGDKVYAQWEPNEWYHGKADKKCATGLHVTFDDGDEAELPLSLIAVDQEPKNAQVKVGTRVLALWTDDRFYPGTVVSTKEGKYEVKFDDGENRSVGQSDLRLLTVQPKAGQIAKAGDKVWAQREPNDWYQGKVDKKCPVGLHVVFDDRDEADLPMSLIVRDHAPAKAQVKVGTRMLALKTDKRFYPATVTETGDEKYEVKFDDGASGSVGLGDLRLLNE